MVDQLLFDKHITIIIWITGTLFCVKYIHVCMVSHINKLLILFVTGMPTEQPAPKKSSSKSKNTDNNGTKKKKTR